MTPTLHLTNWSSRKLHGPGRKFTIMAKPRAWEHGEGTVRALAPMSSALRPLMEKALADRSDTDAMNAYRWAYEARLVHGAPLLRPYGVGDDTGYYLDYAASPGEKRALVCAVSDGDTLCCACSVAEARAGRCHRTWAAPFLVRAGWRVVLDGEDVRL